MSIALADLDVVGFELVLDAASETAGLVAQRPGLVENGLCAAAVVPGPPALAAPEPSPIPKRWQLEINASPLQTAVVGNRSAPSTDPLGTRVTVPPSAPIRLEWCQACHR